jgi:DNA repair protein RadC
MALHILPSSADLATQADNSLIASALKVLEQRQRYISHTFESPQAGKDYARLCLGLLEHEVFMVLFLDSQHRLIAAEEMFRGTVSQTSVYPREVLKAALRHNASAVILAHNHPSGVAEPSRADEYLTTQLKSALAFVDVRVIDHLVVSCTEVISFAERGLI